MKQRRHLPAHKYINLRCNAWRHVFHAFICGLFKDAGSNRDQYRRISVLQYFMNTSNRDWKDTVLTWFKLLNQTLVWRNCAKHEISTVGISGRDSKPANSRIQVKCFTTWISVLGEKLLESRPKISSIFLHLTSTLHCTMPSVFFSKKSIPVLGPGQPTIQWVLGFFLGGKASRIWNWPLTSI